MNEKIKLINNKKEYQNKLKILLKEFIDLGIINPNDNIEIIEEQFCSLLRSNKQNKLLNGLTDKDYTDFISSNVKFNYS